MTLLLLALATFVGSHLLMSHPLRAPMVAMLGATGFQLVYAGVSFVTLGWAAHNFRTAPYGEPLWTAGDALWGIATLIMLAASVLLVGSLMGNPALPTGVSARLAARPARGVFAITRHPMMWSFALWAAAHVIASPRPAVIVLAGAMAFLALGGAAGQDAKKARMMGASWRDWASRTRFVPLSGQMSGAISWRAAWPGPVALIGGTALWLVATWGHPWFGSMPAGIWRWV